MDKEIEQLSTSDAVSLTEKQARKYLNYLRWPETNGKPVCPKCQSKQVYRQVRPEFQCYKCGKQFSYVTWQPFVYAKLPPNKILALIIAARDELTGAHASRIIEIKDDTSVKWIRVIRKEFGHGEVYFPLPNEEFENRKATDYATPRPKAKKKDIAKYILDKAGKVTFNQFERDFARYEIKTARAILNSIINYPKDKLRQIVEGKDPLAESQKEMERLRKKIDGEDRKLLDNIHIDPAVNLGIILDGGGKNENESYLGTEIFSVDDSDFDHLTHELRITHGSDNDF